LGKIPFLDGPTIFRILTDVILGNIVGAWALDIIMRENNSFLFAEFSIATFFGALIPVVGTWPDPLWDIGGVFSLGFTKGAFFGMRFNSSVVWHVVSGRNLIIGSRQTLALFFAHWVPLGIGRAIFVDVLTRTWDSIVSIEIEKFRILL
jgi:hypothetical protein